MADSIPAAEFSEHFDLPDWQVNDLDGGAIEARFLASSFAAGAAFVGTVGKAADEADHHPDVDLRYPGEVRIRLSSHDVGGLSARDGRLALVISELATVDGLRVAPAD